MMRGIDAMVLGSMIGVKALCLLARWHRDNSVKERCVYGGPLEMTRYNGGE